MKIANHKITNKTAREYVKSKTPFVGSNLQGVITNVGYIVYSYGNHWPLFIAIRIGERDVWFENEDRYSSTSSKHRSQCHPHWETVKVSVTFMKRLVLEGYTAIAKDRVVSGVVL